jgi:hypothetical protein
MAKNEPALSGPEFQAELLLRMGYRSESRCCENCTHYCGFSDEKECRIVPFFSMNVNGNGYCDYHRFTNEDN